MHAQVMINIKTTVETLSPAKLLMLYDGVLNSLQHEN